MALSLWRRRCHVAVGVLTAVIFPICLGFRPTATTSDLDRHHRNSRLQQHHASSQQQQRKRCPARSSVMNPSSVGQQGQRADSTRLRGKARNKDDLMEKIGPLIESVTMAREMVPSDLTQDYGSVVLPDPLTPNEVPCSPYYPRLYGRHDHSLLAEYAVVLCSSDASKQACGSRAMDFHTVACRLRSLADPKQLPYPQAVAINPSACV